jgi:hypothetical protein
MAVQELARNLIRFRVRAAAVVGAIPSRGPMAQTEVPAAAAEHHSARVTNQTQELVFPVKVAPVAAEISGQILLMIAEAAAAVVLAQ